MADDALVNVPDIGGDNDTWGQEVNDAIRTLETRINVLRQYVLDHPGGGGGGSDPLDDGDLADLVANVGSATHTAITSLISAAGTPDAAAITVATIAGLTGANVQAALATARSQIAAIEDNLVSVNEALATPIGSVAIDEVTGLVTELATKADVTAYDAKVFIKDTSSTPIPGDLPAGTTTLIFKKKVV